MGRDIGGAGLTSLVLDARLGIASATGGRQQNDDFAAAWIGSPAEIHRFGIAAALADGIGGAKAGRIAAEISVRGFLDGWPEQKESLGVHRAASDLLQSLNLWVAGQARQTGETEGMGCTFTGIVLRGRSLHVLHVGDSRLYRLQDEHLARLTVDHVRTQAGQSHVLTRAIGLEDNLRLDYRREATRLHDRYLLCSDGVHGALSDRAIAALLRQRAGPEETAQAIVDAALASGATDNATALLLDLVELPEIDAASLDLTLSTLKIADIPASSQLVDGFKLQDIIADGRFSRLFRAIDEKSGAIRVIKFPHPLAASEAEIKSAFLREAWIGARIRSPWLGQVIEPEPERASCLYLILPFYEGETLAQRISRTPLLDLAEGKAIGLKLGRAIIALHRAGIIHRDIKPENVMLLADGGLRLLDFGVARIPGREDFPAGAIPGTASYMAPEMFAGAAGSEKTDLFALAVTLFQSFTGAFPYGEIEPFCHPRFNRPPSLAALRPDLPSWLDALLARMLAVEPELRPSDMVEFVLALEDGPVSMPPILPKASLYDRNPLLFWKGLAGILALLLMLTLMRR